MLAVWRRGIIHSNIHTYIHPTYIEYINTYPPMQRQSYLFFFSFLFFSILFYSFHIYSIYISVHIRPLISPSLQTSSSRRPSLYCSRCRNVNPLPVPDCMSCIGCTLLPCLVLPCPALPCPALPCLALPYHPPSIPYIPDPGPAGLTRLPTYL